MKKTIATLAFSFTLSLIMAQPYQFFNDDFTVFMDDSHVFPYKTLSVEQEGNERHYEFQTMMNYIDWNTYDLNGPGFLGQFAVWDTISGKYTLFNRNGDSILLHTNLSMGASWCAWNHDTDSVFATITNIDTQLVANDVIDTIKTIRFSYPENNTNFNETVDNKTFVLSRKQGLMQFFNIGSFPGMSTSSLVPNYYEKYSHSTLSEEAFNPDIVDSISMADMHNWHQGDEIHTHSMYWDSDNVGHSGKLIRKVLSRTDSGHQITLRMRKKYKVMADSNIESQGIDTITEHYSKTPWEKLPVYRFEDTTATFAEIPGLRIKHGEVAVDQIFSAFAKEDGHWRPVVYDKGGTHTYGILGLGGWYYYYYNDPWDSYEELVYYNVDGVGTWGTPLDFEVGLQQLSKMQTQLYPNPVRHYLNIEGDYLSPENLQMKIYNLQGRLVFTTPINSLPTRINVSDLVTGLYFYKVKTTNQLIGHGKFIKQ